MIKFLCERRAVEQIYRLVRAPFEVTVAHSYWAALQLYPHSHVFAHTAPAPTQGTLIMLVHDVSDIFLEAAKLFNYAKWTTASENLFVTFAVVCQCLLSTQCLPAALQRFALSGGGNLLCHG